MKSRVAELKKRYEPIRKESQSLEEAYARIRGVKIHLSGRGRSLEALTELYTVTPDDTYYTDVRFDDEGKFSVKGTSSSKSSVFVLLAEMDKSSLFKNVQTKYVMGRSQDGQEFADFEISAALEGVE